MFCTSVELRYHPFADHTACLIDEKYECGAKAVVPKLLLDLRGLVYNGFICAELDLKDSAFNIGAYTENLCQSIILELVEWICPAAHSQNLQQRVVAANSI